MQRAARLALCYVVLSLVAAPFYLLFAFPHYPSTPLGWFAFFALPLPLVLAGEWLFEYRPFRLLRPIDAWARHIEQSPYRLLAIIGLIAAGGALGVALLLLLA